MDWEESIHLRVKDASRSLDNTNSLIESLNLINRTCLTCHNRNDVESQILRMEISSKTERQSLLLASRNLNIVSGMGEVADYGSRRMSARCQWLQGRERASDNRDVDWLSLVVGEIEESLCRVPVYELHTEDLGLWEGGRDGDGEVGHRWRRIELFFCGLAGSGVNFRMEAGSRGNWGIDLRILAQPRRWLHAEREEQEWCTWRSPLCRSIVVRRTMCCGRGRWKTALVLLRCVQQFSEFLAHLPATYSTIYATEFLGFTNATSGTREQLLSRDTYSYMF